MREYPGLQTYLTYNVPLKRDRYWRVLRSGEIQVVKPGRFMGLGWEPVVRLHPEPAYQNYDDVVLMCSKAARTNGVAE